MFSILIPTFNNLEYLKFCIRSIKKNSKYTNQIIPHVNIGNDGTIEYLNKEKATTSIFYLSTNNGYTEFEDGSTVDSVQNRLVTFPTTTLHRAVGQTDTETRIVLNFNYIGQ